MDFTLTLPSGETLGGSAPVVVIGPNGSGKTRQTRNLRAAVPIDFVNALRNTRVSPELPAMGFDTARSQFQAQRNQARNAHWELTSEFDFMLSQLLAEDAMAAKTFVQRHRDDPTTAGEPPETPLSRVETIWREVFPGRRLDWKEWRPVITNMSSGSKLEYSGNSMSDGERAALYVAGRVFAAEPGILVVDEPETHFHTLLAVRLWDALEAARSDLRFVYVTHDLGFALSRKNARYVLASPTAGLRPIDVDADLPADISAALLGSASLSFYASRVVFCEGETGSLDERIYNAWFDGPDTVVRPVGACQSVLRCVEALGRSGVAHSLEAVGLVERDYHSDAFLKALPNGARALETHEVESILALPTVVGAVASHLSQTFDVDAYVAALRSTVTPEQRRAIIVQRWKVAVEPNLQGLVASTSSRVASLDDLEADLPSIFDLQNWSFSPSDMLRSEISTVDQALDPSTGVQDFLRIVPGKQLAPVAARQVGLDFDKYVSLITDALRERGDGSLKTVRDQLVSALEGQLPDRATAVAPEAIDAQIAVAEMPVGIT